MLLLSNPFIAYNLQMNEKVKLLKKIKIEDLIWLINFFIVLFALTSNNFERDYIINGNLKSEKTYKTINIALFLVAFTIYAYFVYTRYEGIQELKNTSTKKDVFITHLNYVSAILILIGAGIGVYTEIASENVAQEQVDIV